MKLNNIVPLTLVAFCITCSSFTLPTGWFKAGNAPSKYEMGIDKAAKHSGKQCATIQSNTSEIDGFGTLMQNMSPDRYKGKRVRMSGYISSKQIEGWAGFWMRVDGKQGGKPLAFDNMESRSITGSTDWKQYEIVLDIAEDAENIAFGALVSGTGKLWFDDVKFEEVSRNVPTTDIVNSSGKAKKEPTNLDFEE